jgi:hypothetical protein
MAVSRAVDRLAATEASVVETAVLAAMEASEIVSSAVTVASDVTTEALREEREVPLAATIGADSDLEVFLATTGVATVKEALREKAVQAADFPRSNVRAPTGERIRTQERPDRMRPDPNPWKTGNGLKSND